MQGLISIQLGIWFSSDVLNLKCMQEVFLMSIWARNYTHCQAQHRWPQSHQLIRSLYSGLMPGKSLVWNSGGKVGGGEQVSALAEMTESNNKMDFPVQLEGKVKSRVKTKWILFLSIGTFKVLSWTTVWIYMQLLGCQNLKQRRTVGKDEEPRACPDIVQLQGILRTDPLASNQCTQVLSLFSLISRNIIWDLAKY